MSRIRERGNALLESLREATGAAAALVRDESSPEVWWWAGPVDAPRYAAPLDNLYDLAQEQLQDHPLRAGALLRLCRVETPPHGFVYSFAGIYMLLVSFEEPFNRFLVEPHLRQALPIFERLVSRLPPLDSGARARPEARLVTIKPRSG